MKMREKNKDKAMKELIKKVGKKIKKYNMYSKRYRTYYIVSLKGNKIGLSRTKKGGISSYINKKDLEKVRKKLKE